MDGMFYIRLAIISGIIGAVYAVYLLRRAVLRRGDGLALAEQERNATGQMLEVVRRERDELRVERGQLRTELLVLREAHAVSQQGWNAERQALLSAIESAERRVHEAATEVARCTASAQQLLETERRATEAQVQQLLAHERQVLDQLGFRRAAPQGGQSPEQLLRELQATSIFTDPDERAQAARAFAEASGNSDENPAE